MKQMKNLVCQCTKRSATPNRREVGERRLVEAPKRTLKGLKGGTKNDKESILDCSVGCTTRGRQAKAEEVWLSPVDMYDVTPIFMEQEL